MAGVLGWAVVTMAEPAPKEAESKSPTGAAVRSALFPGWGQFYNRKPVKGALFLAGEACLLAQIGREQRQADEDVHRQRRNTLVLWWAGVKLFAIIDAYVDAHLYDFDTKEEPLAVGFTTGAHGALFCCQYSF